MLRSVPWRFPWEDEDDLLPEDNRHLRHLGQLLEQILSNQEIQMATDVDLTAALAQASTDLQTLLAATAGSIPAAALDPVLAAVQALDAAIVAATPAPPAPPA